MSLSKDIVDDSELAKIYITNSSMSDDYKKAYLKLINITTLATNGISPEEKILKMTEAILLLAVTQGMYMVNIDLKIERAIDIANTSQCENCKAMKHALQVDKDKEKQDIIDSWKKANGISDDDLSSCNVETWADVVKNMLVKPYIYIVISLLVISPYGVEIVKALMSFYGK